MTPTPAQQLRLFTRSRAYPSHHQDPEFTWDPEQPGQTIDGIDQMACAGHQDPCTTNAFIGDYFGLAISGGNIYALMVSTHYPSGVTGDGGQTVYYQQQVLATVPRTAFGTGY